MRKNARFAFLMVIGASVLGLSACGKTSKPKFIYMPDMYYTPGIKAQSEGVKPPVKGTFPRDFKGLPETMSLEDAGKTLKNPLQRTDLVLARGKNRFETYCLVCHGPSGLGDGTIVPKFPRPPSLQSDKIRNYADGNIYHVITRGQNLMPAYAAQISQEDRWAIIHYIRALQKAQKPSAADLKAAE
jgi:mono/diheme cytochrome c family protein